MDYDEGAVGYRQIRKSEAASFFVVVLFAFSTQFLCAALSALELAQLARLTSNPEISLPLSRIKGICHTWQGLGPFEGCALFPKNIVAE